MKEIRALCDAFVVPILTLEKWLLVSRQSCLQFGNWSLEGTKGNPLFV